MGNDRAMPPFAPFRGIRYAADDLAPLTAPPYDVISREERDELAAQDPRNVVHIDVPVLQPGSGRDDPYVEAAERLERWREDGTLVTDDPSLYLYRMSFADEAGAARQTLGVIGALGLVPPGEGDVLPHEHTTPKAKSDRLRLMRATAANLSPIWGLSLAQGLSKLLDVGRPALHSWLDPDGVRHELWRESRADAIAEIRAAIESEPVVIADGHHRYETSLALAAERRDLPGAGATLCYLVELVEDQLAVQPIHRLVAGLPDGTDITGSLADTFEVERSAEVPDANAVARLVDSGRLGLITADGFAYLRPRLDGGRIDSELVADALAALPAHELSYQHALTACAAAVRDGYADAAILLRPVSVSQIQRVAHARQKMPPKSTFFWPKPRTGVLFRSLSE